MAESKIAKFSQKLSGKVVEGYEKIENTVVEGYNKIEKSAVDGYTKIEDKFVERYLTKDGETVEYTLGDLLNEAGRYAITVTDECGNVSEYSFEITKGISGWAITGIVVGSLVVIAGAVFIILKKRGTI